eukprot:3007566-Rhodomonas_salina.5
MPGTDLLYGAISIRPPYAMHGTDLLYAPRLPATVSRRRSVGRPISLRACYVISGTDIAYGPTRTTSDAPEDQVSRYQPTPNGSISYAMSGTDLANGDIGLYTCYAMCGTDTAYHDGAADTYIR